jgi:hypothetical protein
MTVPSYFPNSTHDELLARRHSERGNCARDATPKQMSPLDYEPAACCTDSDMAGCQLYESAEDPAVLARRHAQSQSSFFDVPKPMSSLDGFPSAHESVKHHEAFTPLSTDAASAASTPASSTHNVFLASSGW